MSDFSDRPFAAGSIFGLRSFNLSHGLLYGVRGRWTAGENIATCRRYRWDVACLPDLAPEGHRAAVKNCSCGFYAYFDGSNEFGQFWTKRIPAIIEGYGLITIGSRGFRAEKARIVALTADKPEWGSELAEHYPEIPIYDSEEDMLAAHPTSRPEDFGITPAPPWKNMWYAPGGYASGGVVKAQPAGFAQLMKALNESAKEAADWLREVAAEMRQKQQTDPPKDRS